MMNNQATKDFSYQWHHVFRILRRRFWSMFLFAAVTLGIIVAWTLLQTKIYEATATVLIDMETPTVLSFSSGNGDPTISQSNYLTYADYFRTQLAIITSQSIGKQVFNNLGFANVPPYKGDPDAINTLIDQVSVEPIKQTRLAQIHADDPDPKRAVLIANEFAAVFAEENLAKTIVAEALTLMKNRYLELQAKEAELSKRYKAKHPEMIRVHAEMDDLSRLIQQQMDRQFADNRPATVTDLTSSTDDHKTLTDWLRSNGVMGSLKPNNIRVADPAQVPEQPIKPKKLLNLALGLVLATLGACGIAMLQELLDTSVKAPEDFELSRPMPLLGYIPRSQELRRKPRAKRKGKVPGLLLEQQPHSHLSEAYRALRTSLLHTLNGTNRPVVVVSPAIGEGKTTMVCNLGAVLAQAGLNVLLIDADLRRGRLHDLFGLERKLGLTELLEGRASLEAAIKPTGLAGLSLITTGSLPDRPADLLSSERMRELIGQLGSMFDRVLIDTPPVLAVTDASILASMTQTVIAVAQSGRTPRKALDRVVEVCQQARAKLFGVVLNSVPQREAPIYIRYTGAHEYIKAHNAKVRAG